MLLSILTIVIYGAARYEGYVYKEAKYENHKYSLCDLNYNEAIKRLEKERIKRMKRPKKNLRSTRGPALH
jgi:hypothetical protein